jgi:Bacterial transcriptional regulator
MLCHTHAYALRDARIEERHQQSMGHFELRMCVAALRHARTASARLRCDRRFCPVTQRSPWQSPASTDAGTLPVRKDNDLIDVESAERVILAFQPPSVAARLVARIKPYTARTVRNKSELLDELAGIRKRGYGVNWGETVDTVRGLAALIRNMDWQRRRGLESFDPRRPARSESGRQAGTHRLGLRLADLARARILGKPLRLAAKRISKEETNDEANPPRGDWT